LRLVSEFELPPDTAGPPGPGAGRGWGRGRWQNESPGPLAAGGRYRVVLVLERATTDAFRRHAARVQGLLFLAGTVALGAITLVWWSSVRLAEARGRAAVLQAEARNLRALGQAAAGLAHETRNPLGLVRGWAQRLAASGLPTAEQREHARAVVEECDRVTSRINQFLAYARPCAPQLEPVDVPQLLAELAVLLEPDLETGELRLDWSAVQPDASIDADRPLLRQAVFNLVSNAVQFAPRASRIEIALRRGQNGRPRLEVADRGPGVKPEQVASLFAPYFTTRPGGTGLGLAIVRQIAAAHGWQAGYLPRPGGGAIFWLGASDG
jgi:signal transduction histidine kinase